MFSLRRIFQRLLARLELLLPLNWLGSCRRAKRRKSPTWSGGTLWSSRTPTTTTCPNCELKPSPTWSSTRSRWSRWRRSRRTRCPSSWRNAKWRNCDDRTDEKLGKKSKTKSDWEWSSQVFNHLTRQRVDFTPPPCLFTFNLTHLIIRDVKISFTGLFSH